MKKQFKYLQYSAMAVLLFLVSAGHALAQCPMCKAAVSSTHGDEPNPLAEGLNTGIIYLFVLPYLGLALLGFIFYRGYKKKYKSEPKEANH